MRFDPRRTTIISTALLALTSFVLIDATISAHAGGPHGWIYLGGASGEDRVLNYDHRSKSAVASNVDWPLTLVFYNNATINRVKGADGTHQLDNQVFKTSGGPQYMHVRETTTWYWDTDSGRKRNNCNSPWETSTETEHFRIYADGDDRLWSPGFGYYVLGTTHYEYDDPDTWPGGCSSAEYGWSEAGENRVGIEYELNAIGPQWQRSRDVYFGLNSQNHDDYINGRPHYRRSNGKYSIIRVP